VFECVISAGLTIPASCVAVPLQLLLESIVSACRCLLRVVPLHSLVPLRFSISCSRSSNNGVFCVAIHVAVSANQNPDNAAVTLLASESRHVIPPTAQLAGTLHMYLCLLKSCHLIFVFLFLQLNPLTLALTVCLREGSLATKPPARVRSLCTFRD
jgi:hypothetical protein